VVDAAGAAASTGAGAVSDDGVWVMVPVNPPVAKSTKLVGALAEISTDRIAEGATAGTGETTAVGSGAGVTTGGVAPVGGVPPGEGVTGGALGSGAALGSSGLTETAGALGSGVTGGTAARVKISAAVS
jgi:hypothetical protein